MSYTATITSKGTTTIPADFRRKLGLVEGSEVRFEQISATEIVITRVPEIADLRRLNKQILAKSKKVLADNYRSGQGFSSFVKDLHANN